MAGRYFEYHVFGVEYELQQLERYRSMLSQISQHPFDIKIREKYFENKTFLKLFSLLLQGRDSYSFRKLLGVFFTSLVSIISYKANEIPFLTLDFLLRELSNKNMLPK